jgi:hypothetical protein
MAFFRYTLDWGDELEVRMDLAQASSPIILDGDPTPYQVADARHDSTEVLRLLLTWLGPDYCPDVEDAVAGAECEEMK